MAREYTTYVRPDESSFFVQSNGLTCEQMGAAVSKTPGVTSQHVRRYLERYHSTSAVCKSVSGPLDDKSLQFLLKSAAMVSRKSFGGAAHDWVKEIYTDLPDCDLKNAFESAAHVEWVMYHLPKDCSVAEFFTDDLDPEAMVGCYNHFVGAAD